MQLKMHVKKVLAITKQASKQLIKAPVDFLGKCFVMSEKVMLCDIKQNQLFCE